MLQQYLPFTVLKLNTLIKFFIFFLLVATVLTVYGIETHDRKQSQARTIVATVLTVYGIETCRFSIDH